MPGFGMTDFIGPVKALDKLNIQPEDITDVIVTHAHHDHIEYISRFKKSKMYIQRDEYESGKQYFTDGMDICLFDDEKEICRNLKAIKIGSHSKGSCIVEIIKNDKQYIISGDECYMKDCLVKKIPTDCSYAPKKCRKFIEKYSDEDYIVLSCHKK